VLSGQNAWGHYIPCQQNDVLFFFELEAVRDAVTVAGQCGKAQAAAGAETIREYRTAGRTGRVPFLVFR
jgi:hypothetical protein